jgi:formate hydrogenlyase subunit 6/NADH:ubiquinone oxidoreductase subunit I
MKRLIEADIQSFLKSVESRYDVWVPVRLADGTRSLGRLGDGPLALAGGALPQKPTRMFFPQMDVILSLNGQMVEGPAPLTKPLLVTGFTAEDVDCLAFIDRFYGENFRDTVYFSKRDNAVIVAVTGRCGRDGRTLKTSAGNCDLELVCDGKDYLLLAHSEIGKALADGIRGSNVPDGQLDAIKAEADTSVDEDRVLLEKASKLLLEDKVPDAFWEQIADRCIACTSCNMVCPTCTCFEVFDRKDAGRDERWRMWDSCQLDGFMREASGHNPMGKEATRTRRRIHHKLGADPRRWGQITCLLCGRCDEACPTGIGIKAVCREMVEQSASW